MKKLEVTTLDYNELEKRSTITETDYRSKVVDLERRLVSYERMEKVGLFKILTNYGNCSNFERTSLVIDSRPIDYPI